MLRQIAKLDRLDPQILRQQRLVLPNLTDHRLGRLTLEEELDELLGLGADDPVEEHVARIRALTESVSELSGGGFSQTPSAHNLGEEPVAATRPT